MSKCSQLDVIYTSSPKWMKVRMNAYIIYKCSMPSNGEDIFKNGVS